MENNNQHVEKKPFYKKWWVWLIAGLTVLGIIGGIFGGTVGGESSKAIEVNEWGTAGNYQVRVVSVENTKEFGTGLGHFTTQNNYVCILVELKNDSNYTHSFSYSDFKIVEGSNKYESKGTEAYWYSESKGKNYPALYLNGSIDGGLSGMYYLVFETAKSTNNASYQLIYSYGFDTITINLK